MKTDQAHDTLITIRTLMERSSIYRRTLAPIMLFVGTLGILGAVLGIALKVERVEIFATLWLGIAATAVSGAFLIARHQAMKDKEAFWSAPTRRVTRRIGSWPRVRGTRSICATNPTPSSPESKPRVLWSRSARSAVPVSS